MIQEFYSKFFFTEISLKIPNINIKSRFICYTLTFSSNMRINIIINISIRISQEKEKLNRKKVY